MNRSRALGRVSSPIWPTCADRFAKGDRVVSYARSHASMEGEDASVLRMALTGQLVAQRLL